MGGLSGSIAAGALAGIWLGPVGVGVGAFVGGVAGEFLKRFTGMLGTDEAALAIALHDEIGMDGDRVNAIFLAMDESYNTDADDIAVLYLQRVFARRGSPLQALTLNRALRTTLMRLLDEGWTTREEAALMARVQALR